MQNSPSSQSKRLKKWSLLADGMPTIVGLFTTSIILDYFRALSYSFGLSAGVGLIGGIGVYLGTRYLARLLIQSSHQSIAISVAKRTLLLLCLFSTLAVIYWLVSVFHSREAHPVSAHSVSLQQRVLRNIVKEKSTFSQLS